MPPSSPACLSPLASVLPSTSPSPLPSLLPPWLLEPLPSRVQPLFFPLLFAPRAFSFRVLFLSFAPPLPSPPPFYPLMLFSVPLPSPLRLSFRLAVAQPPLSGQPFFVQPQLAAQPFRS